MRLPSPHEIKQLYPSPSNTIVQKARKEASLSLEGKSDHLTFFVGPCSIHDVDATLEYASRLQKLSTKLSSIKLLMRVFLEKPRTLKGWTGLIYDPFLNGTNDVALGITMARKLLVQLTEMGIACVTELLEPLIIPYFDDLISWGMIGARTSASQPHRQLASSLPFPVGFKNGIYGELDTALYGALSAQESHTRIHMDEQGHIASQKTKGNPWTHLVLRGSENKTNYAPQDIQQAVSLCKKFEVNPKILIDCSHGNSKKDYTIQPQVFHSVMKQIEEGNRNILGVMLESHLHAGKQPLGKNTSLLRYGVSITDSCLGWTETEELILEADVGFQSVQK